MKNIFLSHQSLFGLIYPMVAKLPKFVIKGLALHTSRYLRNRLSKKYMPDILTLIVTDRCNLKCCHCFISTPCREKNIEMTVEEYKKIFNNANGVFSKISFSGGEPTIRKDLGDIIVSASCLGGIKSGNLMTNGILCNNLISAAKQAFDESDINLSFQVSIDGTNTYHDTRRGVDGALNKTLKTIKKIKELKRNYKDRVDRIIVNTVISKENFSNLHDIIKMIHNLEVLHIFSFVRSSKIHTYNISDYNMLSDFSPVDFKGYLTTEEMDEAIKIINKLIWAVKPKKMIYAVNRVVLKTMVKIIRSGTIKSNCFSGLGDIVILPNGDVARCEMLKSFANLKTFDWNISDLIHSDKFKKNYQKSLGCFCTHDCSLSLSIMYDENLLYELIGD